MDNISSAASSQIIEQALITFDAMEDKAACVIEIPPALAGVVFASVIGVGEDIFVEATDGRRFQLLNLDAELFEVARACRLQRFEIFHDGIDAKPEDYEARFVVEPVYGLGA